KQFTVSGSYLAPLAIQVAGVLEHRTGDPYARDVRFRTGLSQLSEVVMLMEPLGAERYPTANLMSLRVDKQVRLARGRLDLQFDLYNALNINAATASVTRSGSTFGKITAIVPP